MHTCSLCGDPCESGEQWCVSCGIDIEAEIDEMLDGQQPGVD